MVSRPTWARGLKHYSGYCRRKMLTSRPTWARGLKLLPSLRREDGQQSRPTWARGLKLFSLRTTPLPQCRAPRGRVD